MKKGALILASAMALGLSIFFGVRTMMHHTERNVVPTVHGSRLPELSWLQNWLRLNDAQFSKVKDLHLDYLPKCEKLCAEMNAADTKVFTLSKRPGPPDAAMFQALHDRARLAAECQQALLTHLHETAACMDDAQARAFLDRMIPHALGVSDTDNQVPHQH